VRFPRKRKRTVTAVALLLHPRIVAALRAWHQVLPVAVAAQQRVDVKMVRAVVRWQWDPAEC